MIPPKVISLIPRLGTAFDGEVVATRDAIGRLLLSAGLDWHDLAKAISTKDVSTSLASAPYRASGHSASFGDLARAARDLDRGQLTPKERGFVADMVRRGFAFQPSPRQAAWLADIVERLQGRAAA